MGIRKALRGRLRHPAGGELGQIDPVRQRQDLHRALPAAGLRHGVHADGALRRGHTVKGGKIPLVVLCQAQRRDQAEVIELCLVQIVLPRQKHGWLRRFQPGKKADAQRDDGQNRQIPSDAVAQLPQIVLSPRASHYHSISSTGVACSLMVV